MSRIARGRLVRVTEESPHHVGECGHVDFYGTGASEGVAVLCIERHDSGYSRMIAVDENHIALLLSED